MYRTGDHIVYGSYGLCEIREIVPSPLDRTDPRLYYVLHPVHASESAVIFSPVENENVIKRLPMTRDEALDLLADMGEIEPLTVEHEKQRRDVYRAALRSADPRQAAAVLRTVMDRRAFVRKAGRRLTDADADNEKRAHDNLTGEIAYALAIPLSDASERIDFALGMTE